MNASAQTDKEFVALFYSAKVYEHDHVCQILKAARIPHFGRQITISGLSLAMPVMPAAAPGMYWGVFVPQAMHDRARTVLEAQGLTITPPPAPWAFAPAPCARRMLKMLIVLILAALAGMVVMQLLLGAY
ncbi:MAG: hypothetical protein NTV22_11065 [bacterium]|nr:hypothetical protein [bacterium]